MHRVSQVLRRSEKKMRLLVVLLLGCSLAQGRLVTKCELTRELMEVTMKENGLADENFVAKIVCHADLMAGFNTSAVTRWTPGAGEQVWTLHGVFQLGDRLACGDGATASSPLCSEDCSDFTDDDIADDIKCLLRIFTILLKDGFNAKYFEEIKPMVTLIFQEKCKDKEASEYFAECF